MHRILTLLLLLGVLAGLLSGRFVHLQHHEGSTSNGCGVQAAEAVLSSSSEDGSTDTKETVCPDAHGGQCHHHTCQHTISPGVNVAALALTPISRLLGSVPAASVPAIDEPVYELDTPPLI